MPSYTARVELHDASYSDYVTLHAAMQAKGFDRTITGSNGKVYSLPTGTYDVAAATVNIDTALAAAVAAANQTGKASSVIVVERLAASWQGLSIG